MITARYEAWCRRILELIGITREGFRNGNLPGNLLLGHAGASLEQDEVRDLFYAVRDQLAVPSRGRLTPVIIRQKLRGLRGLDLLPLLFSMAMVARQFGEHHRYWPQFREWILPQADIHTVRQVAADLRFCWIKLYEASQYRLYYPQEGLTNIKWPIAHAGLLASEEAVVERFGMELAREALEGEVHPILRAETDEFQQAFAYWLIINERANKLTRRVKDPATGLVAAELAQLWVISKWPHLLGRAQSVAVSNDRQKQRGPSVYLQFDPVDAELTLVLSNAVWPGQVPRVTVEHDGRVHEWPVSYHPETDTTKAGRLHLPLRSPDWDGLVNVTALGSQTSFPIIRSPFKNGKGALFFDADTGRRTRKWEPGRSYYLIIPPGHSDPIWTDALFDSPVLYTVLQGGWEGYRVLYAEASEDVLSGSTPGEQVAVLQELEDSLQKAEVSLRLPGLTELSRPRIRPVGGLPIRFEATPTFLLEAPPAFEITGACHEPLSVLLYTISEIGEWSLEGALVAEPGSLLSLSSERLYAGAFKLQVNEETYEFTLRPRPPYTGKPLTLDLSFGLPEGAAVGHRRNHKCTDLEEGLFCLRAWPGAEVAVRLDVQGQTSRSTVTVPATGQVSFRLSDVFTLTSYAPCSVKASYGPLHTESHTFYDSPRISDLKVSTTKHGLRVVGLAHGAEPGTGVSVFVLGSEPWDGHLWSATGYVSTDGHLEVELEADLGSSRGTPRYIVIGEGTSDDSEVPSAPPWFVNRLSPSQTDLTYLRLTVGSTWARWVPVAGWLARHGTSDADLDALTVATVLMGLAQEASGGQPLSLHPCMIALSHSLSPALPSLIKAGCSPRLSLWPVSLDLPYPADPGGSQPLPGLALPPSLCLNLLEASDESQISLNLECCSVGTVERCSGEHLTFTLTVEQDLVWCRSCNRIVPFKYMNRHSPAFPVVHECKRFQQLRPGSRLMTRIAILWAPEDLLNGLTAITRRAIEGTLILPHNLQFWLTGLGSLYRPGSFYRDAFDWMQLLGRFAMAAAYVRSTGKIPPQLSDVPKLMPFLSDHSEAIHRVIGLLIDWRGEGQEDAKVHASRKPWKLH